MVYSWCLVDSSLPNEAKQDLRKQYILQFGPAGLLEQDDNEMLTECAAASKGWIARKLPFNHQLGMGHERPAKEELNAKLSGTVSGLWSEANQRGFYKRWLDLMTSEGWPN